MSRYGYTVDRDGFTIGADGKRMPRVPASIFTPFDPDRTPEDRSRFAVCATEGCAQRCISNRGTLCPACMKDRDRANAKRRMQALRNPSQ